MQSIDKVKGVGPKTVTLLNKIGIYNIEDLLTHYPYRYDVLSRTNLETSSEEDKVIIDGKVESIPILLRFKGNLNKLNFRLVTSTGNVGVSIFNRAFLKSKLTIGTGITVIGKFDKSKNIITASDIKFGLLSNDGKIESVYHTTNGLTSKNINTYINQALLDYGNEITDYIPDYLVKKYDFLNKKTALNIVHNPPSIEKIKESEIRLKYEELFAFMFKINYLRESNINRLGIKREIDKSKIEDFINTLPFTLTNDQTKTIYECIDDLNHVKRMNRLIEGDVGSGKTIVSIVIMYANYLSGYQSALMAPTEILANQHYNNVKEILKNTNIKVRLLTGSTSKKDKDEIYKDLKNGDIDIIIGTHALIQNDVEYNNLGLVITDEQHRFGVNQRANLKNKGIMPDVLYMSATPIPRTYALTIYGDMDVSIIKEMPKGRQKVDTFIKSKEEIKDVLELMYEELKKGHQIYVVSPLIEEGENSLDLTTVNELRDKFDLAFGKKYNVGLVHGKMIPLQKDLVMKEFQDNKVNILISTTVIEVGVDNPNATMMVIFDANRFGLSTLHQLRGRVGRGSAKSTCILISDTDTKRLKIMESTSDGFEIAENDFKLRGSGDLFGTKQSGDMIFKIANIRSDYKILVQARDDSKEFLLNKKYDKSKLKERLLSTINDN